MDRPWHSVTTACRCRISRMYRSDARPPAPEFHDCRFRRHTATSLEVWMIKPSGALVSLPGEPSLAGTERLKRWRKPIKGSNPSNHQRRRGKMPHITTKDGTQIFYR